MIVSGRHYDKDSRRWFTEGGDPFAMPPGPIELPGWVCACGLFNGTLKGRTACRGCGLDRSESRP
jgi:hypothetical protein